VHGHHDAGLELGYVLLGSSGFPSYALHEDVDVPHLSEVFLGEGVAKVSHMGEPEVVDLDDEYGVGAEAGSRRIVVVCLDACDGGSLDLGVGGVFEDGCVWKQVSAAGVVFMGVGDGDDVWLGVWGW